MLEHDLEAYQSRWQGFGWHALIVDGHAHSTLVNAFAEASRTKNVPTVLLAKTLKGKGITFAEDLMNWHGKALNQSQAEEAIRDLTASIQQDSPPITIPRPSLETKIQPTIQPFPVPTYNVDDTVATREAFGEALARLGTVNPFVVALDADVKNSTFTDKFGKQHPDRFFENFIAEQNMIGAAVGLAACGKIPFAATFACFLTRAYDFIRMAAISQSNIKLDGISCRGQYW